MNRSPIPEPPRCVGTIYISTEMMARLLAGYPVQVAGTNLIPFHDAVDYDRTRAGLAIMGAAIMRELHKADMPAAIGGVDPDFDEMSGGNNE